MVRASFGRRHDGRRADRRLRGGAPAAARAAWLSAGPPVLSHILDDRTDGGAAPPARPLAHGIPERLRAVVAVRAGGVVGRGTHYRLRPAALVAGHRVVGGGRGLRRLPVLQRHHVLHARLRGHGAHRRGGTGAERGRIRPRLRLPGRHRQLPAGALSGLFAARDHHRAVGCPGRVPAQRRRTAAAAGGRPQPVRRRPLPGRVGALGGGAAGKSHLVSGAELLPLAARKPVVGRLRSRPSSTRPRCCWRAWTGRTATRPG